MIDLLNLTFVQILKKIDFIDFSKKEDGKLGKLR